MCTPNEQAGLACGTESVSGVSTVDPNNCHNGVVSLLLASLIKPANTTLGVSTQ